MSHVTPAFVDLVRVETRLYNAVSARLRDEQGVSIGQFEFLEIIDRVPGCRVLDIVGELAITVGAVSKAVDRLVAAGWCQRVAHPQDRRSSVLRLTDEGARRLAASRPVVESALVSLTAGVSPEELSRVASTLATLRAALEAGSHGRPG
ncbi:MULTISPECIES: MarR family winged helix-turn-helix transcriptional regulator [Streptomyces]|uniref:MarR family winged helix-turn-helix transcriptional regulator n=1 Tax=Streptomyces TaxID=1883 RepID=UPI0013DD7390|nr:MULTISPECIES: MarR family winged helix-turn-helix transcriptional regulator [Streptomyces]KAF2778524.1 MarR family transcriptional regulator [Streptomyces sp. OM5714]MDI6521558.1 MarR family winged helix-turn-helix transcriptional regulator [Streptomyces coelicoflavus]NHI08109.1 MarR family transcriptional regulator [Streptomyces sp. KO7888]